VSNRHLIPNWKPKIVEVAIRRETAPLIGHHLHPHDPTGRTALCGVEILGVPTNGIEHVLCFDCGALAMAGDWAPCAQDSR
jgi:hypothetical protein